MRLEILDVAKADLIEGFRFYEAREAGLGRYFLTNLYADIESLKIFGGIHRKGLSRIPARPLQTVPLRHLLHHRRRHRPNPLYRGLPPPSFMDQNTSPGCVTPKRSTSGPAFVSPRARNNNRPPSKAWPRYDWRAVTAIYHRSRRDILDRRRFEGENAPAGGV